MTDSPATSVSEEQLEAILETLMEIMRGQFNRRLPVEDTDSHVDALHLAINMTAEELARKTVSSEYVQNILRFMVDMLFVVGPDASIHTVNDAVCESLGFKRLELVGNQIRMLNDSELMELFRVFTGPDAPEAIRDIEFELRASDGSAIPVMVNGSAMRDEQGNLQAVVFFARDMRRARELLVKAERAAASDAIIEGMPDAVTIIGFDGTIFRVNSEFERSMGYDRREAIGERPIDLGIISRADFEKLEKEIFPRVMEKGYAGNIELSTIRRDGTRFPILMNMSLMTDASGHPTGIISVARDISQRKKAENRIDHLNRVLRAIRNVNELIVKEKDRQQLIDNACRLLVQTRGYNRAWIALGDGSDREVPFAQAGWGDEFSAMAEHLKRGEPPPCRGQPFPQSGVLTVRNPSADCVDCPLAHRYSSDEAMAVRLEHDGEVYGLMGVSIPGDFVADVEEQALFRELASDIGFALYNIGLEEERNRTLQELKQSNQRYKTLFDGAAEGIAVADIETQEIRYANPAFCEMLGYTQDEFRKMHMPSIHPREDRDYAIAEFEAQARGARILSTDVPCLRKDGTTLFADVNTAKIVTDGKEYNLSFYTDVTERKRAEERVGHLNQVLRAIRRVNQLIVKEKDRDRLIDSACKLLVQTRGYGSAWIALLDGSGKPDLFAQAGWGERFGPMAERLGRGQLPLCGQKALSHAGVLAVQDPSLTCDTCPLAAEYFSSQSMVARFEHAGKVFGVMGVSIPGDFSADQEEQSLFDEVASDIAFALYNIEIQDSLRRSEVMSRMGVLLGDFAHEVRNPLFSISATIDAFEARFGHREEFGQYLEVLRGELNRTKNLMHELLEYGRPTSLGETPGPIEEVVVQAVNSCARLAQEHGVTIDNQVKAGLSPIYMDRSRLVQALGNVLTNAIQFSRSGDTVTVEVRQQQQDGRTWLVCSIIDNGPGFMLEDREIVFEPFFSSRRGGTGLGLSIVRRVMEDHQGSVSIDNQHEGGAVVTMRFPCP